MVSVIAFFLRLSTFVVDLIGNNRNSFLASKGVTGGERVLRNNLLEIIKQLLFQYSYFIRLKNNMACYNIFYFSLKIS